MLRAAVIGAGMIAKQHLGALGELEGVEVVGVCDLSPVMAESTADRFGVREWRTDHHRLLEELRPDFVHVTTPASTHFAIALDCLYAGASVFVEKPVTTTVEDFDRLASLAESKGLWLVEDYNYRFNADVLDLLSDVRDGAFGDVHHVDVQVSLPVFGEGSRFADRDAPHPAMREPLGAVSDFLTHLAYLAHGFVGAHRSVAVSARKEDANCPDAISEFKALVDAERGTALLGFSAGSEVDGFWLRVEGFAPPRGRQPVRGRLGRDGGDWRAPAPGADPQHATPRPQRATQRLAKPQPQAERRTGRVRRPLAADRRHLRGAPFGRRASDQPAGDPRGERDDARRCDGDHVGGDAVRVLVTGATGFLGRHVVAADHATWARRRRHGATIARVD